MAGYIKFLQLDQGANFAFQISLLVMLVTHGSGPSLLGGVETQSWLGCHLGSTASPLVQTLPPRCHHSTLVCRYGYSGHVQWASWGPTLQTKGDRIHYNTCYNCLCARNLHDFLEYLLCNYFYLFLLTSTRNVYKSKVHTKHCNKVKGNCFLQLVFL